MGSSSKLDERVNRLLQHIILPKHWLAGWVVVIMTLTVMVAMMTIVVTMAIAAMTSMMMVMVVLRWTVMVMMMVMVMVSAMVAVTVVWVRDAGGWVGGQRHACMHTIFTHMVAAG